MGGEILPAVVPAAPLPAAIERRLRCLVAAMWPYPKIVAEFSEFDANAVRVALERLLRAAS